MSPPRVHILVLHWGNPAVTAACLDSLRASDFEEAEVVLIDNGTPDRSGEKLAERYPEVTLIRSEENLGFAGGNNLGLRRTLDCGADYAVLLNNDAEVRPDAMRRMLTRADSDPHIGLMNPKILYHDPPNLIWYAGGRQSLWSGYSHHIGRGETDRGQHDTARPVTFVTGCALLIRREALAEIGLLDESLFMYAEDLDWSRSALKRGWQLWFEPGAVVIHREPVRRRKSVPDGFRLRLSTRNLFRVSWRHANPLQMITATLWLSARWLAYLSLKNLALGFPGDVLAIWKGLFDAMAGRTGNPRSHES